MSDVDFVLKKRPSNLQSQVVHQNRTSQRSSMNIFNKERKSNVNNISKHSSDLDEVKVNKEN